MFVDSLISKHWVSISIALTRICQPTQIQQQTSSHKTRPQKSTCRLLSCFIRVELYRTRWHLCLSCFSSRTMYQVPRMMVPVRTWQQPQQRALYSRSRDGLKRMSFSVLWRNIERKKRDECPVRRPKQQLRAAADLSSKTPPDGGVVTGRRGRGLMFNHACRVL